MRARFLPDPQTVATAWMCPWRAVLRAPGPALGAALVYAVAFAIAAGLASFEAGWAQAGAWAAGLAAFVSLVAVIAVFTGEGLGAAPGRSGRALAADTGRLVGVAGLSAVLILTVLGTVAIALIGLLTAIALATTGADLFEADPQAPADLLTQFGAGDWIATGLAIALFTLFSLWFIARLLPAIPATLEARRVKSLTVWPRSKGRAPQIVLTLLLAAAPGLLALTALQLVGAGLERAAWGVTTTGLAFLTGLVHTLLIAAPVAAALGRLYRALPARDVSAQEVRRVVEA